MSHQIFLVSFGAFTILMFLIKNSASKTVSVFLYCGFCFDGLVLPDEVLSKTDILGFIIASIGFMLLLENKL